MIEAQKAPSVDTMDGPTARSKFDEANAALSLRRAGDSCVAVYWRDIGGAVLSRGRLGQLDLTAHYWLRVKMHSPAIIVRASASLGLRAHAMAVLI
jgi:hypothetical protein